ncbi:hypothetical protein GY45DRAFT_84517 [Cubamyces sp. BRFM 1775]|nr:hypothetical protein GY45DRAFT_84517 [Cubamyces sp. BRFM 1775]
MRIVSFKRSPLFGQCAHICAPFAGLTDDPWRAAELRVFYCRRIVPTPPTSDPYISSIAPSFCTLTRAHLVTSDHHLCYQLLPHRTFLRLYAMDDFSFALTPARDDLDQSPAVDASTLAQPPIAPQATHAALTQLSASVPVNEDQMNGYNGFCTIA